MIYDLRVNYLSTYLVIYLYGHLKLMYKRLTDIPETEGCSRLWL